MDGWGGGDLSLQVSQAVALFLCFLALFKSFCGDDSSSSRGGSSSPSSYSHFSSSSSSFPSQNSSSSSFFPSSPSVFLGHSINGLFFLFSSWRPRWWWCSFERCLIGMLAAVW
ncbi:uncharacterized protein J3D65DRAFT_612146 [Phyllosticta citribraziliensis]|uniref:Secreted protein n=1 Tax=Phyllosticta citribraziliensis TaxID=989973 RepID=A0ABR1M627_9PEZI